MRRTWAMAKGFRVTSRGENILSGMSKSDTYRDLWQEALMKLEDKDADAVRRLKQDEQKLSGKDAVKEVVREIENQKGLYAQRPGAKARDKSWKILNEALKFSKLVDAGLKFDPSGYGKLNNVIIFLKLS
jgi:hypothetical protein